MTNIWRVIRALRRMAKQVAPMQRMMLHDTWRAAQASNPDLIIYHPKAFGAPHFAEKLGVPAIMGLLIPMMVPTADYPAPGFPNWRLGGGYNRLTYAAILRIMKMSIRNHINTWRKAQALPQQPRGVDMLHTSTREHIPVLHGVSRHVVPEPSDWPAPSTLTGYWFLDRLSTWQPPAELQRFLDAGDAPVYVGFGSMAGRDPQRLTQIVIRALQQVNLRGVLATGWGGLAPHDVSDTIMRIDHAPHDWLFPHMAAVVHHGGAGTTAAGLRAGRPTLICPFFGDQPYWGQRVNALGVGIGPLPQKKLTVEKLTAALRDLTTHSAIRHNAEALGEQLRDEDGVTNAVGIIEGLLRPSKS